MSWVKCVCDSDYEIFTEYPFQIRKKKNQRIVKEYLHKGTGYVALYLSKKFYRKHRIIALQFIPNPNPEKFKFVDHIDRNRLNNEISNLRWVSNQINSNNRNTQQFVDELPDDSFVVERYKDYEFEFLYFSLENNRFYYFNGINYAVKSVYQDKYGNYKTYMYDRTGIRRTISYNKFKREKGLI